MPWSRPRSGVKRGPKPFPGTRRTRCDLRVPPVQSVRHNNRYPKKRKIDVLLWLVNHRVADTRRNEFGQPPTPRLKSGQKPIPEEQLRELKQCKDHIIYRPATYREAEKHWNIQGAIIASWWQRKEKYLPSAEIEKSKYYMIKSSPNRNFKPPGPSQNESAAQKSTEPPTLQPSSNAATQSRASVAQPKQAVVEISDDSEWDSNGFISDDDEDLPDIETAFVNSCSTEDEQMSKDIQELQKIFDDSDTDLMPNAKEGASTDPQGHQSSEEIDDAEESEDPELFGSI
ncbi:uncharacterized protein GGS22DRAFT_22539 [Annulohypoxylon maeteangense]|uniref:uncharacterized protein n=1 Tax=Annulohypoxylon maeteangense TaxID=1927788 RepID=UPI002007824F|nr:uncharacterized protein GGS22DRAFT_22539 [Annulohypoxylon maeteangense]KAI0884371.1 hypothetical protein GGS22DRAFT_22539 [Annulohypoxylon maeteangense]